MRSTPEPDPARLRGRVLAAVALALAAPILAPAPLPPLCPRPGERGAEGGVTRVVTCAGLPDRPLRGPARLLYGLALDPNTETAATLEALEGIGPALAARIVEARRDRPFCATADLRRVRGIGPLGLRRLGSRVQPGAGAAGFPEGCLRADFRSR